MREFHNNFSKIHVSFLWNFPWIFSIGTPPEVISVLRIHSAKKLQERYQQYQKSIVQKRPELSSSGYQGGKYTKKLLRNFLEFSMK